MLTKQQKMKADIRLNYSKMKEIRMNEKDPRSQISLEASVCGL